MLFNEQTSYGYGTSMDRGYVGNQSPEFVNDYTGGSNIEQPISGKTVDEPILTTGQLGQTVGEGRGSGTFLESLQAAVKKGVGSVELSLSASGSEPGVGPDTYTKDKLEQIKEIAKANQVEIMSVHTPVQVVSNVSGYVGPQQGFVDEQRFTQVNEVKKAIQFAANTTDGGAVVVHTGEFLRPMSEAEWSKGLGPDGKPLFKSYEDEDTRYTAYLVDDRTGRVIGEAKKSMDSFEPLYKTASSEGLTGKRDANGHVLKESDWVDIYGNWINPEEQDRLFDRVPEWDEEKTRFKTRHLKWQDFEKRAEQWNQRHSDDISRDPTLRRSAEEEFWKTQMENRELQYRGSSLYHGQRYEQEREVRDKAIEMLQFYERLEEGLSEEEKVEIMRKKYYGHGQGADLIPPKDVLPSEYLKDIIKDATHSMRYTHEASSSADAQADMTREEMKHIKTVGKYAKEQSSKSYAEAGIYAMDMTKNMQKSKPIFVAPENIFPEMGYGSHPDELIELVQISRNEMKNQLMEQRGYSEEKARKMAENHIKITLDTEHLGMWKKHFTRKTGESEDKFNKRFDDWYLEQVKKMQEKGIIGHLHIADGFGYGHANLPAGQGNLPVVDAVAYLKKHGYKGAYLSEGYGDAQRMMRDAWRAFGSPIYSPMGPMGGGGGVPRGPSRWGDVQHAYFGQNQPPFYVFGAYSPSNEWQLWSQVPLE